MDLKDYVETDIDITNADTLQSVDETPSRNVAASYSIAPIPITVPSGTWTTIGTLNPSGDHDIYFVHISTSYFSQRTVFVRVYDETDSLYYPDSAGLEAYEDTGNADDRLLFNPFITIPKNVSGHTLRIQYYHLAGADRSVNLRAKGWGQSPHTHDHTEYTPLRGQTGNIPQGHPH